MLEFGVIAKHCIDLILYEAVVVMNGGCGFFGDEEGEMVVMVMVDCVRDNGDDGWYSGVSGSAVMAGIEKRSTHFRLAKLTNLSIPFTIFHSPVITITIATITITTYIQLLITEALN